MIPKNVIIVQLNMLILPWITVIVQLNIFSHEKRWFSRQTCQDSPIKHVDFPMKNGDVPIKNGDLSY